MLLRSLFILLMIFNINLSACAASAATAQDFTVSKGELRSALGAELIDQLNVKCIEIGTRVSVTLNGTEYTGQVSFISKEMCAGGPFPLATPARTAEEQEPYVTLQQVLDALPDPVTASWGGKTSASSLTDWFIQVHVLSDGTLVLPAQMYKAGDKASWLSVALTPKA